MSGAAGQLGQAQADVLLGCMEVCMEDMVAELTGGAGECEERGGSVTSCCEWVCGVSGSWWERTFM
jgi:hypothetical protein